MKEWINELRILKINVKYKLQSVYYTVSRSVLHKNMYFKRGGSYISAPIRCSCMPGCREHLNFPWTFVPQTWLLRDSCFSVLERSLPWVSVCTANSRECSGLLSAIVPSTRFIHSESPLELLQTPFFLILISQNRRRLLVFQETIPSTHESSLARNPGSAWPTCPWAAALGPGQQSPQPTWAQSQQ